MQSYWIATYRSITNTEALAAYAKLAGPAIWAAEGRNLARGTPTRTLEAGLDLRTVITRAAPLVAFALYVGAAAYAVADRRAITRS